MKFTPLLLLAPFALSLALPAAAQEAAQPDSAAAAAEPAASAAAEAGPVTEASVTDVREGIQVRDPAGGLVGRVESVDSEGAVVSTGNVRAKLPFRSFGKNNLGLVISLTRSQLEAAAAAQSPS
jgi:hypothetical protein